jgi:hypothetical protein
MSKQRIGKTKTVTFQTLYTTPTSFIVELFEMTEHHLMGSVFETQLGTKYMEIVLDEKNVKMELCKKDTKWTLVPGLDSIKNEKFLIEFLINEISLLFNKSDKILKFFNNGTQTQAALLTRVPKEPQGA